MRGGYRGGAARAAQQLGLAAANEGSMATARRGSLGLSRVLFLLGRHQKRLHAGGVGGRQEALAQLPPGQQACDFP